MTLCGRISRSGLALSRHAAPRKIKVAAFFFIVLRANDLDFLVLGFDDCLLRPDLGVGVILTGNPKRVPAVETLADREVVIRLAARQTSIVNS